MRIRNVLPGALLALSCTILATTTASADPAGAKEFVMGRHSKIKQLVEDHESDAKVKAEMEKFVDYDELARRTMGKPCPTTVPKCTNYFDQISKDKQVELTAAIHALLEKNYLKNMKKAKRYSVEYTAAVEYKGAGGADEGLAKVKTVATDTNDPRASTISIAYVIKEEDGKYRAVDLITEGSSMVKNYYDQNAKTMKSDGIDALIAKYKKKTAKISTD
jgi:phospholipid transport system substrate-binding protein